MTGGTRQPTKARSFPTAPRWLDDTEDQAWKGLLAIAQRAFPEIERDLRAHDMLGVHYHILVSLSAAPDQAIRLCDLANSANLSQSRLTHRLRTLIDRGDIVVTASPDDGRTKLAKLTPAGGRRLETVPPQHVETVRRLIFDHLSAEQVAALAEALAPVATSLNDHPEYLNPNC